MFEDEPVIFMRNALCDACNIDQWAIYPKCAERNNCFTREQWQAAHKEDEP